MTSFKLTNVSTTFQKIINKILRKYFNVFVIAYLNDILIYFNTKKEHEQHVRKVLKKLKKAELKVKLKKSRFHVQEIKFLKFIIRYNQIRINSEKIKTITDWSRSIKTKDILALAEFANFYRNLIESFFEIMHSLNELLKKSRQWEWEIEQENAFQTLKKKFVEKSILKIFDDKKQTVIEVDASNYVMSACLLQEERSMIYFSKTFQSTEINYDVSDKKLLTIVSALRNWRVHLKKTTHRIKILSNHDNLVKFITTKKLNRRQVRWSEKLVSYNFDIEHVSRKHNEKANALSRRSDYKTSLKEEKSLLRWKNNRLKLTKLSASKTVSEKQQFKEHYSSEELRLLKRINEDFYEKAEVLYFQESIFVLKKLEKNVLKQNHDELLINHKDVNVTWIRILKKYFFSKMKEKIKKYVKKCEVCVKTKKSRQFKLSMQSFKISNKSW